MFLLNVKRAIRLAHVAEAFYILLVGAFGAPCPPRTGLPKKNRTFTLALAASLSSVAVSL